MNWARARVWADIQAFSFLVGLVFIGMAIVRIVEADWKIAAVRLTCALVMAALCLWAGYRKHQALKTTDEP